jgi:hypothetical protein
VGFGVGQLRDVQRVQPVHVFLLQDAVEDGRLVQMGGDGQLHQDAVDGRVSVQLVDLGEKFFLGDGRGEIESERCDADLCTRPLLGAHVGGRVTSLAHQNHGQAGNYTIGSFHFVHSNLQLFSDCCRDGSS